MDILSIIISIVTLAAVAILIFRRQPNAAGDLSKDLDHIHDNIERTQRSLQEEIARNRIELNATLKNQLDTFSKQLTSLTQLNEQQLEKVRGVVEVRLKSLQEENSQKLEKMRETVDEKLHSTLEKRLGE